MLIAHLSSSYCVTATEMVSGDATVSKTFLPSRDSIRNERIKKITEWPCEEGNEQSDVTWLT